MVCVEVGCRGVDEIQGIILSMGAGWGGGGARRPSGSLALI